MQAAQFCSLLFYELYIVSTVLKDGFIRIKRKPE